MRNPESVLLFLSIGYSKCYIVAFLERIGGKAFMLYHLYETMDEPRYLLLTLAVQAHKRKF
jgi:hypothetical protein